MSTMTLVGTPDPDEDLRRRVEALESLLTGELQQLRRSLGPMSSQGLQERLQALEAAVADLTEAFLDLRASFQGHVHHAAPQTTGGVV